MIPPRYTPDADHDRHPDLIEAMEDVRRNVLYYIEEVEEIHVHAVKNIRHLGKYVHGSKEKAVILVSVRACERASKKYDVDLYTSVFTTILHELAHAIQEVRGLPFDEEQAERFARTCWESGGPPNLTGDGLVDFS
jgi:hypothetical protein